VRAETDLDDDPPTADDRGAGEGQDSDDEEDDLPRPERDTAVRLRAILSGDSSDDEAVPDDALAV
jgi:hypothetical protein